MRMEQTHLLPPAHAEPPRQALSPRGQEDLAAPGREEADSVELTGSGIALRQIADALRSSQVSGLPNRSGIPAESLEPAEVLGSKKASTSNPTEVGIPQPVSAPEIPAALASDDKTKAPNEGGGLSTKQDLTEEEQRAVEKLKNRDREVRAHEQAHLAAAGPYAIGGPTYEYQRGPDNRQYAAGGEVQIDTSEIAGDPQATIRKAQTVRGAAQAPAEPSSQDRSVAAAAARMESAARQELAQQRREKMQEGGEEMGRVVGSGQSKESGPTNLGETHDASAAIGTTSTTDSKRSESAAATLQAGAQHSSGQYANSSSSGDLLDMIA